MASPPTLSPGNRFFEQPILNSPIHLIDNHQQIWDESPIAQYGGAAYRSPVAATTLQKKEHQDWFADKGRRRSMRVLLNVPVAVKGKTATNQNFDEETRTLVVNAHGALISVAAQLAATQEITIANKATKTSQKCRVVYVGRAQAGKTQVGVEFVDPSPSFWQIDFPPEDWVDPGD